MAANKLTHDEVDELRYFWRLGAKPLDLAKAYHISPEAAYAHTTYKQKRDEYRKKYYSHEMPHVKAQRKAWQSSPKGKRCVRNVHLKKAYGITLADYEAKQVCQNNRCAICDVPGERFKKGLAVDHNHLTGKVRGLLCVVCNTALEKIENEIFMEKAKAYLRSWD